MILALIRSLTDNVHMRNIRWQGNMARRMAFVREREMEEEDEYSRSNGTIVAVSRYPMGVRYGRRSEETECGYMYTLLTYVVS